MIRPTNHIAVADARQRRWRVTADYEPDPTVVRLVASLDPSYRLKWNNCDKQWELWRVAEYRGEIVEVFLQPLGRPQGTCLYNAVRQYHELINSELMPPPKQPRPQPRYDVHQAVHALTAADDQIARWRLDDLKKESSNAAD